MKSSGRLVGL